MQAIWELEGVRNAFKTEQRWKSQRAWGEGRHLRSRGTGNWALVPRVTQGQVYRLERETAVPKFPYSQIQEMINRFHSPSIPVEPRNAVLLWKCLPRTQKKFWSQPLGPLSFPPNLRMIDRIFVQT